MKGLATSAGTLPDEQFTTGAKAAPHATNIMKTRINLLAVLAIITLALSSFAPAFLAQSNKPISTKELKVLLKTAKEPAEHGRIAQYYRQQSADLNASSAAHLRTALTY